VTETRDETTALAAGSTRERVARQAASIRRKAVGYSLLGALAFLGVWMFAHFVIRSEAFEYVPSPWKVGDRMLGFIFGDPDRNVPAGKVFENFWDTLRKVLLGWGGAVVLGVPIGVLMGRFRYARDFFFDLVYLAANVPLIVYAVLSLLLFGVGDTGPAVVVAVLVLPIIAINVAEGVESVDPNLLAMSRAYRLPPREALRHIVFPSFYPFLFAGARVSFADSWKLGALTETFGGQTGVGVQLRKAFQIFAVADLLAWMMFFVIFVLFIERVVLMRLERYAFRYRLKRGEDVLRY
jgi:NitT/TauT family transport system permease protein